MSTQAVTLLLLPEAVAVYLACLVMPLAVRHLAGGDSSRSDKGLSAVQMTTITGIYVRRGGGGARWPSGLERWLVQATGLS